MEISLNIFMLLLPRMTFLNTHEIQRQIFLSVLLEDGGKTVTTFVLLHTSV